MPYAHDDYLDEIAGAGASLVTHISLIDDNGDEITDRQSVTWDESEVGIIQLDEDMSFEITGGDTVAGWRGWDAETDGTELVGDDLPEETYNNDGQYVLLAEETGVSHELAT